MIQCTISVVYERQQCLLSFVHMNGLLLPILFNAYKYTLYFVCPFKPVKIISPLLGKYSKTVRYNRDPFIY